jgi:hypothetical protein
MLSLSVVSCSSNESTTDSEKKGSNEITSTDATDSKNTDNKSETNQNSSILESYKKVLQNKENFYSTDSKKDVSLNDFLANNGVYGVVFKLTRFAVIDMDGDKIPEVVLELTVGDDNVQFFEVLHNSNSKVNGYLRVLRGLGQLKEDGSYMYSNSASDSGFAKLIFEKDGTLNENILAHCEPSKDNDATKELFYIQNKSVTDESYTAFVEEQNKKKDVTWYQFSQENIEKELSTK